MNRDIPLQQKSTIARKHLWSTLAALVAGIGLTLATPAYAVDIHYDFEGDSGTVVIDKLIGDGAANGTLQNYVTIESTTVPYGSQALRFGIGSTLDQYSTFELPDTMDLGTAFTLSAFVNFSNTAGTRLFSNWRGTGATTGAVLFDLTPASPTGLRLVVNGQTTNNTGSLPTWTGYHHVAATYDDGIPALYVDGVDVGTSFQFGGGIQITSSHNLRFGEDPHFVPSVGNEGFNGNVDDILVVNRALSVSEIAAIAAQGVSAGYSPAGETRAIHYSFEGDTGTTVTDQLGTDGAQHAIVHQMASVDAIDANAVFGTQSGKLVALPTAIPPLSRVNLGAIGNLGEKVTIAAVVNMDSPGQTGGRISRLFSTYQGSGSALGKLLFDADPNAANLVGTPPAPLGVRVILPDGTSAVAPNTFTTGEDHLFAFTYDSGSLKLYLDGVEVAAAMGPGGPLDLGAFNLLFGEDSAGNINEQLVGVADDLLVLGRALSASDMMNLYTMGASAFLASTSLMPDLNMDGFVDIFDVNLVSDNWGTGNPAGDANKDGIVDIFDVNVISDNWNPSTNGLAVPEPSAWLLMAIGLVALVRWRRTVNS